MSKESEAILLDKLDGLTKIVAELVSEKQRREGEKAERIDQIHRDILGIFKARNAGIEEMYISLKVTEDYLNESFKSTLKLLNEPPVFQKH
jgi:ATP phosphoribosyltransferase